MKYVMGFFAFWYDFIVGDAWEVAAGVAISLVVLYLLAHNGVSGAWLALLLPVAIVLLLGYSLWRVARPR